MLSTKLAKDEKTLLLPGPARKLELIVSKAKGKERKAWGVVCHPHPMFGGTMHNKVVTTLAKTLQALGLDTVRFNFRGVGKSEGSFDQGEGELYDLLTVIEWVLTEKPKHDIWLAGFSFGACIAAIAASQIPVKQLITVAPPVSHFAIQRLPPILCPWVLVQGERDDIVSPQAVFDWAAQRNPKPTILRFKTADHFFHGQLVELREQLIAVLPTTLS